MKLIYTTPEIANGLAPSCDEIAVFSERLDPVSESSLLRAAKNADAFVFRTSPDTAGFFDPLSLDVSWADASCFAVKLDTLQCVGGFDLRLGCAAACDLVWRLKGAGKRAVFVAGAKTDVKEEASYADRLVSTFLLRCKYGSLRDIIEGKLLILKAIRHPDAYGVRGEGLFGHFVASALTAWKYFFSKRGGIKGEFFGADYCLRRGKYLAAAPKNGVKVSFAIRTHARPDALRNALTSVRNQSYANVGVVVVEDGNNTAEEMIRSEFSDLDIIYEATGKPVGRTAAANRAFSLCDGEYINMLDDDDYLFPEHTEMLVGELERSCCDVVFAGALSIEKDKSGIVRNRRLLIFPRIDEFTMARQCLVTDNGVMFKRELFTAVGGMREELESHEDWNFWLRLMAKGSYTTLPYATCCYVVPAEADREKVRLEGYSAYDDALLEDQSLVYAVSAKRLKGFYDGVIHDLMYLKQRGELDRHLEEEYRRVTGGKK